VNDLLRALTIKVAQNWKRRTDLRMSQIQPNPCDPFIQSSAVVLDAMANARRLMILAVLLNGEVSVGPLSVQVGLTQSALSQHLSRLRKAGLVTSRREAQSVYYHCASDTVKQILATLKSFRFIGDLSELQPVAVQ
jgi:DNA-binding transcriptional ArsR family regulator